MYILNPTTNEPYMIITSTTASASLKRNTQTLKICFFNYLQMKYFIIYSAFNAPFNYLCNQCLSPLK